MRAVVVAGTRSVIAEDVVVRVTSSAICGTDLHMYDGRTAA
jgi:threonine dehydrogenase-like Zn-dependent dehydrogenase